MAANQVRRQYFDPQNPCMLSAQEISRLSATECATACDQIDQQLVTLLQDIDAEFVRSTRLVTDRILPELETYGEASRGIWEGIKFWQGFFAAAANVNLTGYAAPDVSSTIPPSEVPDHEPSSIARSKLEEASFSSDEDATARAFEQSNSPESVSKPSLQILSQDMRRALGKKQVQSSEPESERSRAGIIASHSDSGSLTRPQFGETTLESSGSLKPPELEMLSLDNRAQSVEVESPFLSQEIPRAEISILSSLPDPDSPSVSGPSRSQNPNNKGSNPVASQLLRHQVLMKQMMGGRDAGPIASTPFKKGVQSKEDFPVEASPHWNGLVDLRSAKLSGFDSPTKKKSTKTPEYRRRFPDVKGKAAAFSPLDSFGTEDEDGSLARFHDRHSGPPESIPFSVITKARLARTPAKEAARLVTDAEVAKAKLAASCAKPSMGRTRKGFEADDELEEVLEPPSVVKEWATRGYDTSLLRTGTGLGAEGSRRGFEEEAIDEEEEEEEPEDSFRFSGSNAPGKVEVANNSNAVDLILASANGEDDDDDDDDDDEEDEYDEEEGDLYNHLDDGDDGFTRAVPQVRNADESGFMDHSFNEDDEQDASVNFDQADFDHSHSETNIRPGVEETLFGVASNQQPQQKQRRGSRHRHRKSEDEGSSSEDDVHEQKRGGGKRGNFQILAPNEIDTLRGGMLLESQPFEASPLHGKDWRGL